MKLSIITVSFNACPHVAGAIESVLGQRGVDVEYIVIDGGSTDGTVDEVARFGDRIDFFVSEPDDGLYDAMNKGLERASGEVVGFLNADDVYEDDRVLARVAERLDETGAECLYGDLVYTRRDDLEAVVRYWRSGAYWHGRFRWGWMPPHPAFFARRELYERYGDFRTELAYSADYELMFRFLHHHRAAVAYLPEILVRMRRGGHSGRSIKGRIRANLEVLEAWRLNGYDPKWYTAVLKPLSKVGQWVRSLESARL
ncbi:MAG: glycosyltransferase family 2 protein [Persicimonas sp.]